MKRETERHFYEARRKAKNDTQEKVAEKLSTTKRTLSKWEHGVPETPLRMIEHYATTYNVSADYLLGYTDAPTRDIQLGAVCDYLGLSEEAVGRLKALCQKRDAGTERGAQAIGDGAPRSVSIMDDFLRSNSAWLLFDLLRYLRAVSFEAKTDIARFESDISAAKNLDVQYQIADERHENNKRQEIRHTVFDISEVMQDLANELCDYKSAQNGLDAMSKKCSVIFGKYWSTSNCK